MNKMIPIFRNFLSLGNFLQTKKELFWFKVSLESKSWSYSCLINVYN